MSAQYRPYRDEESVDGLEATTWSDQEPGSIQIYEKTTEELPFNAANKRALWTQIALLVSIGVLGFLLGYFAPFHRASLGDMEMAAAHFNSHEDPSVRSKILTRISGSRIRDLFERYENTNRIPGSHSDHEFAQYINDRFEKFGLDRVTSTNYTFKTMLPSRPSVVALLSKENKTIYSNLDNEHYAHDDMRPMLPLSQASETIFTTDQILYVNRGSKADYVRLTTMNVGFNETQGKVFVIRQGYYQAHDVVIEAQESGARAVLLFPDPDVFGTSSPFPKSVRLPNDAGKSHPTAWSNYGDLASFNLTSIDTAKLGLDKEAKVQIPVIPISFDTASKILRGLSGPLSPSEWNCFAFTLYLGPAYREENNEDKRSQLRVEFYNQETSITAATVTGVIKGSMEPDRYVVMGSRRDSLNRGLLDSVSGTAIMLELAHVFSGLLSEGWRPRRTIIFNSFGAESLNLIGSSNWLEANQRLLHSRAVAYLNCDLVITGNHSASIAASPLLYQVLYNATRQVANPRGRVDPELATVYDVWREAHNKTKRSQTLGDYGAEIEKMLEEFDAGEPKLVKGALHEDTNEGDQDDNLEGSKGILHEYKKSAIVKTRPRVRRLDLQSIYSPFFLYAGIPVVDVRYAGFAAGNTSSQLMEDTLPLLGTKYDNLATVKQIDPHYRNHVAVAQVLGEMLRDLSDSAFLPFNLLDYATTLMESYHSFASQYGNTVTQSTAELESLRQIVQEFFQASIKFHHRQDQVDLNNAMAIRNFNDQLMLLERAFLDPNGMPNYWERKHIILAPNDGQDRREGFPGLVDLFSLLEGDLDASDYSIFVEILKVHYKAVVFTISNAIKIIDDVFVL